MATSLEMAKQALSLIGTRTAITSLSDGSNEAAELSLHLDTCRKQLLSQAWWNFARYTAVLTLNRARPGTPEATTATTTWDATWPQPPWLYSYHVPADFLQARYVTSRQETSAVPIFPTQNVYIREGQTYPFILGRDTHASNAALQARVILTNAPNALLCYTADITETGIWDEQFVDAYIHLLAARAVYNLTGDKQRQKQLYEMVNEKIVLARIGDGNEGLTMPDIVPDFLAVRTGTEAGVYGAYTSIYPPLFEIA